MPSVTVHFGSDPKQGGRFVDFLAREVDRREITRLAFEGGFGPPNNFPVERLVEILDDQGFPKRDLKEFAWAISETDSKALAKYSLALQIFLLSLHLYCDKRKSGAEIDAFYRSSKLLVDSEHSKLVSEFLRFLEWLHDEVPADPIYETCGETYEDYELLLSWLLLRRFMGETDHRNFGGVLDHLLAKRYEPEYLDLYLEPGIEAWDKLHQRIPCPEEYENAFEEVIWGMPAKTETTST